MYVFIQTDGGRARAVVTSARALPGVAQADVVWGPYDVVVIIESASPHEVLETLKSLPHIHRALPCPIIGTARAGSPPVPANAGSREER